MKLGSRPDAEAPALSKSVLFVLPWHPDSLGGVGTCVINLCAKLFALTGYRAVLLQNEYGTRTVSRAQSRSLGEIHTFYIPSPFNAKAPIKSVLSYLLNFPVFVLRFHRLLKRENVQAVNLHYPGDSAVTVLLIRAFSRLRFRVVLSFHGADVPPILAAKRLQRLIWRVIFRRSDAVVGCSRYLANVLLMEYPLLAGKTHVIHNGVDVAFCANAASATRLPTELKDLPYVVVVGRFEEKKAHEVVLESFPKVLEQFPAMHLVLVGTTGPTLPAIRRLADAPSLRDRVLIYTDLQHETTLAVIAHATLLVLPSRSEPFGIVIIEAGALDTPVIASNGGGVPEIIDDGRTGLLVPVGDSTAFASAICRLLGDAAKAAEYAAEFKAVVTTQFSWDRALLAYIDMFRPPHR